MEGSFVGGLTKKWDLMSLYTTLRNKENKEYCLWNNLEIVEIEAMVHWPGDILKEVFVVLGKNFADMPAKYRTIFILLDVYMLVNMSVNKVIKWMEINCI